jgi:excisionase family DNA binding protein
MPPKNKAQTQGMVTHRLGTEIYTTADVAQALKLSGRFVLNAIERGDLEARKAGKSYLITREAVRRYVSKYVIKGGELDLGGSLRPQLLPLFPLRYPPPGFIEFPRSGGSVKGVGLRPGLRPPLTSPSPRYSGWVSWRGRGLEPFSGWREYGSS